MNVYTRQDLSVMQAWPLERKIRVTQAKILEWYHHYGGKVAVSFSGGKDSTVLLDLARRAFPDLPAVFVDTGLEYPEIRDFVKTVPNVTWLRPEMPFSKVLETYGYPVVSKEVARRVHYARQGSSWALRHLNGLNSDGTPSKFNTRYMKWRVLLDAPFLISDRCCSVMKERPLHKYARANGLHMILGTMASESVRRQSAYLKNGCNAYDKREPTSQPLAFWTEQDVLAYDDLPIVPFSWRWKISRDKWTQFEILKILLHREDVGSVINACDAGREGELIFRTVYCMAGCTKPMQRLWISSMEDDAIRSGFQNLRPGSDYDGLHQSALCRAKADWLVGINATRLFSVLYHRTLNVGRVLSPTLALLVQRETEIGAFRAEPFYTVQLDCGGVSAVSEKFKDNAAAAQLADACADQTAVVKCVEQKERTEKPPALYDLTTLQRDANRILGYTTQQTLDYLQALYEKKLCTYPRTDARYLTDDTRRLWRRCVAYHRCPLK